MQKNNQKVVAIFGAGIAGLTAAHEFMKLGYKVKVFEANKDPGGFFRSSRLANGQPTEYSWHGIGPWYHNLFDLLKEIPYDEENSLYDKGLSRPIDFGIAPNNKKAQFDEKTSSMVDVKKMFQMSTKDKIMWAWIMLKVWCSHKRSTEQYSTVNAKDAWQPYLSEKALDTWAASFGPWVGSDWQHVSLHQAGHFFRKQLITKPNYEHKSDKEGSSWIHGARSGWLLLTQPSNEIWFDRWVKYLEQQGVEFIWETKLKALEIFDKNILSALLHNNTHIQANIYILAINPFVLANIIKNNSKLMRDQELSKISKLVEHGEHVQVSFRIAFKDRILWPRKRCAIVLSDSPYDITMFAQEQVWDSVDLGENTSSLWTATACASKVKGSLHGLILENCTKDQFIEEVIYQMKNCQALDTLIREANNGKGWKDFPIERIEVWHEWKFSSKGIVSHQPKWVNSIYTQEFMPNQKTSFKNLALAGAHTKTDVDVWSIEAAVESGKRAAKVFQDDIEIKTQYVPQWLKYIWKIDDIFYSFGIPNIVDIVLLSVFVITVSIIYSIIN